MSAVTFDTLIVWLRSPASIVAAGVAVKLMDDYLDAAGDRRTRTVRWAARIGAGTLPYSLFALTVALLLDTKVAAALFLGAYAIGMAHDLGRTMPTGLKGWQESVVAAIAAVLGTGWTLAATAFAAMIFVQCLDDMEDTEEDLVRGQHNFVHALGSVETALLAVASFIVAVSFAPQLTLAIVVSVAVIEGLFHRTTVAATGGEAS